MRCNTCAILLTTLLGLVGSPAAYGIGDNFATDPLAGGSPWSFGVGSNANSQFTWSAGALGVHIDTRLPTERLDLPLGTLLDDASNFLLSARFSFHVTTAAPDQFAQFAFGLTNHALTGGDRTGSFANFASDNTFHTVEFDYYPNVSPNFGGPTLSPAVFGAPLGDAFANFTSVFGSPANLGDNVTGITELPQDTLLEAQLAYDGSGKILTLSMYQVAGDNTLALLDTGLVPLALDVFPFPYKVDSPFSVDSLSIMAYQDGYTSVEDPSLIADVTFHSINLSVVPEPSAAVLLGIALVAIGAVGRRLRRGR